MKCPNCGRAMVAVFLNAACDYCDYGPATPLYSGVVLLVPGRALPTETYVFQTALDARVWSQKVGQAPGEVREVLSLHPIIWHQSKMNYYQSLWVASMIYEVFPDHRYIDVPYRAYLAPELK